MSEFYPSPCVTPEERSRCVVKQGGMIGKELKSPLKTQWNAIKGQPKPILKAVEKCRTRSAERPLIIVHSELGSGGFQESLRVYHEAVRLGLVPTAEDHEKCVQLSTKCVSV